MDGICLGMVVNNEYVLYDIIPSSKLSFFFFLSNLPTRLLDLNRYHPHRETWCNKEIFTYDVFEHSYCSITM